MSEFVKGGELEVGTCLYMFSVVKEDERMSVWCRATAGRSKSAGGVRSAIFELGLDFLAIGGGTYQGT